MIANLDNFIDLVVVNIGANGTCTNHLESGYLVSFLLSNKYNVVLFKDNEVQSLRSLALKLLNTNSSAFAFFVDENNYDIVASISRILKCEFSIEQKIVVFGPSPTFSYSKILLHCDAIDYCIILDPEITMLEILNGTISPAEIKGLAYVLDSKVYFTGERMMEKNLDFLPSPYLNGVLDPIEMQRTERVVTVMYSRGCTYKCVYCRFAAVRNNCIRFHSLSRIVAELVYLSDLSKNKSQKFEIRFLDDLFTANRKNITELCAYIRQYKIQLNFRFHTRPDCVDEEIIKALAEAGCTRISFGLESGNPLILNEMKKARRPSNTTSYNNEELYIESAQRAVRWAKKYNIESIVNLIVGWPSEVYEDHLLSMKIVESIDADKYFPAPLIYYEGTELYKNIYPQIKEKVEEIERNGTLVLSIDYSNFPELFKYNPYKVLNTMKNQPFSFYRRESRILQVLMGIGTENLTYLNNVLLDNTILDEKWLKDNLMLNSKLTLIKDFEDKQIINFSYRPYGEDLARGKQSGNELNSIVEMQVSKFYSWEKIGNSKSSFIVSKEREGTEEILNHILNMDKKEIIKVFSFAGNDTFVKDFCKWCNSCSIEKISKITIKSDGLIYLCADGKEVCSIKDGVSKSKISNKVRRWKEKAMLERGCELCEVKSNCSICVSLGSLSPEAYCALQKLYCKSEKLQTVKKVKKIDYFFK